MGGRRGDADTRMTCRQKAEMVTEENASQELRRLQREKERAKSRRLAPPLSHPVTRDALSFTRLETQRVQAMAPGCLRGTSSADHRVSRRWLPPLVLRLVLLLQLTSHSVSDARRLTHSLSRMATAGAQQQRRWRARGRERERGKTGVCAFSLTLALSLDSIQGSRVSRAMITIISSNTRLSEGVRKGSL